MSIKTITIAMLSLAALSGCALAPGPRLDSSRMHDDLNAKTGSDVYPVSLITSQLIADQAVAASQHVAPHVEVPPNGDTDYRVGVGDIIGVTIWNHPELTAGNGSPSAAAVAGASNTAAPPGGLEIDAGGQRVAGDGTIFFPTLGRIKVAGKTTAEISTMLTHELGRTTLNPQLEAHILQFRSQQIQVTGEVRTPGTYSITDAPLTIVEAIARSGGTVADADLQRVQLTRAGKTITLDIDSVLAKGIADQNLILRSGDILNVPDHSQSRVFVLGEVLHPQALFLNKGHLTLADALTGANGIDPSGSDPRQVFVIRRSEDNPTKPTLFRLDMSQIDAILLTTQFDLRPLDIVYVGTSTLTHFNRGLNQLLPTAESLYLISTIGR